MLNFIAHSANTKTGDIPQTYTKKASCPASCRFKNSGCYGDDFRTLANWKRCEFKEAKGFCASLSDLRVKLVDEIPAGELIRHNVAGDMAVFGGSRLDADLVRGFDKAFEGYKAYTYTHCTKDASAFVLAQSCKNLQINFSCETENEVDLVMSYKSDAVITLAQAPKVSKWVTKGGNVVVLCPNHTKGIQCKKCKLCSKRSRGYAIAFVAHGQKAQKVKKVIMLANANEGDL